MNKITYLRIMVTNVTGLYEIKAKQHMHTNVRDLNQIKWPTYLQTVGDK